MQHSDTRELRLSNNPARVSLDLGGGDTPHVITGWRAAIIVYSVYFGMAAFIAVLGYVFVRGLLSLAGYA